MRSPSWTYSVSIRVFRISSCRVLELNAKWSSRVRDVGGTWGAARRSAGKSGRHSLLGRSVLVKPHLPCHQAPAQFVSLPFKQDHIATCHRLAYIPLTPCKCRIKMYQGYEAIQATP
jgi:hypothetical protein